MGGLRTKESERVYRDLIASGHHERGCPLCAQEPVQKYRFWKITVNEYPYDRIAEVHHMIVLIRHGSEHEITTEEWREYNEIKHAYVDDHYEFIVEATHRRKSLPSHFHVHLIVANED